MTARSGAARGAPVQQAERIVVLNRRIAEDSAELVDLLLAEQPAPGNDAALWLTVSDFAERIDVSPRTVYRMIAAGLPVGRASKKPRAPYLIPVPQAEAWMRAPPAAEQLALLDLEAGSVR